MHSRSISGESKDIENEQETFAGIPLLVVPSTPVKVRGCVMHIKKTCFIFKRLCGFSIESSFLNINMFKRLRGYLNVCLSLNWRPFCRTWLLLWYCLSICQDICGHIKTCCCCKRLCDVIHLIYSLTYVHRLLVSKHFITYQWIMWILLWMIFCLQLKLPI